MSRGPIFSFEHALNSGADSFDDDREEVHCRLTTGHRLFERAGTLKLGTETERTIMTNRFMICLLLVMGLPGLSGCMTNAALQAAKSKQRDIEIDFGHYEDKGFKETGPHPQHYFLLPLTVPADIVTAPFQLYYFGFAPRS
jgi:hypothetical protein